MTNHPVYILGFPIRTQQDVHLIAVYIVDTSVVECLEI